MGSLTLQGASLGTRDRPNLVFRVPSVFVRGLGVIGRILAASHQAIPQPKFTSLFSTASDECAISSESWFALSSQVAEAKHVAGNESYVGTKDSERLSLRRRCIREKALVIRLLVESHHSPNLKSP